MKQRVNWTISKECLEILKQSKKLNETRTSISKLVEYAIKNTYRNKIEYYREQMKLLQQKLMEYSKKIEDLETDDNKDTKK